SSLPPTAPARMRSRLGALVVAAGLAGCGGAADGGPARAALVFDACAPLALALAPGEPAARAAAIAAGAALWNDRAFTRLGVDSSGATGPGDTARVALAFQRAAAASHGLYDPAIATIFLNVDLDGD